MRYVATGLWLILALGACSDSNGQGDGRPADRWIGDGPPPVVDQGPPGENKPQLTVSDKAPATTARLVFIHHSVGENWLRPDEGNLIGELNKNNYYVTDTNYEWGPDKIGDNTDIGHWYDWFLGPKRDTYMAAVYKNTTLTDSVAPNSISDPGGEASIVMFKSCFTQGPHLSGNAGDPPLAEGSPNPIYGKDAGNQDIYYTVTNVKGMYRDLLKYFATRQDKLFVLITPPPSEQSQATAENMSALRGVTNWLVEQLLQSYPHNNVGVFDFSLVLTSNGGSTTVNDVGAATGSHHRFRSGTVEHLVGPSPYLQYWSDGPDNHPTAAGSKKATAELVPLLNILYNCWKKTSGCPRLMGKK